MAETQASRRTRYVSWMDLERVAAEAADIDSIVRSELEAVGEQRTVDDRALEALIPSSHQQVRHPRRPRARIAMALVVAAAASIAVLIASNVGDRPASQDRPSAAPRGAAGMASAQPPASHPTLTVTSIEARLSFTAPCWVEAVADGRTILAETVTGGMRALRASRTLRLTLGNGGGVHLVVNDRPVTTGATGQVVNLSFVVKDGKLVAHQG